MIAKDNLTIIACIGLIHKFFCFSSVVFFSVFLPRVVFVTFLQCLDADTMPTAIIPAGGRFGGSHRGDLFTGSGSILHSVD